MRRLLILLISTISLLFASLASASDVIIRHPYVRATPPNTPTSALFLMLENKSDKDRVLISASTPVAGRVELHTHIMDGDIMKMRQVETITVPAQGKITLKPGGLHIMLFQLKQNLREGETIDVTLNFLDGNSQMFKANIKKVMQGMMKH